jgi:uncharacterized membrane protein
MDGWLVVLVGAGAVGSGLMAGLFFAFSAAVMPALRQLAPSGGIAAMQAINRAILNPNFLLVFMGTTVVAAALAVTALWTWDDGGAELRLAGGLSYVIGVFLLTAAYHVPRNNALDQVAADDPAPESKWATYLAEWVPWNHVRTLASLASLVLFVVALRTS